MPMNHLISYIHSFQVLLHNFLQQKMDQDWLLKIHMPFWQVERTLNIMMPSSLPIELMRITSCDDNALINLVCFFLWEYRISIFDCSYLSNLSFSKFCVCTSTSLKTSLFLFYIIHNNNIKVQNNTVHPPKLLVHKMKESTI